MRKTIRVRVSSSVRRVGNTIRVEHKVSNGSSTRTIRKTIRPK
ncbi:hypothetical protein [Candidatus Agathobaculum pullicola]